MSCHFLCEVIALNYLYSGEAPTTNVESSTVLTIGLLDALTKVDQYVMSSPSELKDVKDNVLYVAKQFVYKWHNEAKPPSNVAVSTTPNVVLSPQNQSAVLSPQNQSAASTYIYNYTKLSCHICGQIMRNAFPSTMTEHMQLHEGKVTCADDACKRDAVIWLACDICGKGFKSSMTLRQHNKIL